MYTLGNEKTSNKKLNKTVLVYFAISIAAIVIDNVYALFGHGIRSPYMSLMFLYPLLGGAIGYLVLRLASPQIATVKSYRFGYNIYNAGIATLTTGSFFRGILEIAGTASNYSQVFIVFGWFLTAVGMFILTIDAINAKHRVK